MAAYVHGVLTRSVDDLVKALGADTGIAKSEVSRIRGELDGELTAFKERPLDHTVFPHIFLDAIYCKARVNHRSVSQAVVIATGISAPGHREILGPMVGDSQSKPFWTKFLRSLRARGPDNVQLVISDSHSGLVAAIAGLPRRGLAAVPGSLRARCLRGDREGLGRDGGGHHPQHLRADHRRRGPHPAERGGRHARRAVGARAARPVRRSPSKLPTPDSRSRVREVLPCSGAPCSVMRRRTLMPTRMQRLRLPRLHRKAHH